MCMYDTTSCDVSDVNIAVLDGNIVLSLMASIQLLYARALAWTKNKLKKKRLLRNEKLKANRTSETEEKG